jgi:hypothetical protein
LPFFIFTYFWLQNKCNFYSLLMHLKPRLSYNCKASPNNSLLRTNPLIQCNMASATFLFNLKILWRPWHSVQCYKKQGLYGGWVWLKHREMTQPGIPFPIVALMAFSLGLSWLLSISLCCYHSYNTADNSISSSYTCSVPFSQFWF